MLHFKDKIEKVADVCCSILSSDVHVTTETHINDSTPRFHILNESRYCRPVIGDYLICDVNQNSALVETNDGNQSVWHFSPSLCDVPICECASGCVNHFHHPLYRQTFILKGRFLGRVRSRIET